MSVTRLEFAAPPSPLLALLKAPFSGGGVVDDRHPVPRIEASLAALRPDLDHVRRYAAICGYRAGHALPLTYPHVMAAPLHLAILTHRAFPLRLPGLVHVRNAVHQVRSLDRVEPLRVNARVGGHRDAAKGIEFDLETRLSDRHGDPVWYSTSTYLAPSRGRRQSSGWEPPELRDYRDRERWTLPTDLGRRYGWLAGDINPIHLHPLAAKLFGFQRHIAHGMWSFGRAAAALCAGRTVGRVSMDASFHRPVFLPGSVRFLVSDSGADYAVVDDTGEIFHLTGGFSAG
ncbi:hypothetical protein H0Z60_16695 [Ectothiorhodospiraceae bacterium WFHF3C12]|nr:hypothetical protein [Ectothiorhodospiraceae bacterium WFHF3C12]